MDDKGGLTGSNSVNPVTTASGIVDDKGGSLGVSVNSGSGSSKGKTSSHEVDSTASSAANTVQLVLKKFDSVRDQTIAERKALLDKLEAAKTDADRKAVLNQIENEQKLREDERRALGKEIRGELRANRAIRQSGGIR